MELKSLSDIKVAKGKSTVDAFQEVLSKYTPEDFVEEYCPKSYRTIKKLFGTTTEETEWSKRKRKEVLDTYSNAFNDKDSFDKAYKAFSSDIMADTKITKDYFNNLASKGYQALYDYNDKDAGDNPLIVFNRMKTLKTTNISDISISDYDKAEEWLEKHHY